MSTSKMIVIKSSDGEIFEVEEAVAVQSQTIAHMVEDDCIANGIPLANVTGVILAKVIEYCKKHVVVPNGNDDSSSSSKEELKTWDMEFISNIDSSTLLHLVNAAYFLKIEDLIELTCKTVADMIEVKTLEEIRSMFNIKNDYTPEEEAQVRAENQWAFE